MLEMGESLLIILTIAAMIISLFLILIPAVPVSALEWALALIFGALTGFTRLTPIAAIIVTVFMALGSTSGLWMPLIGFRGREISCLGMIAFFIGMIAGSVLIPIPFIGTIIGGVVCVILVEFARLRRIKDAVQSGKSALKVVVYGMLAEFIFGAAIVVTTFVSILTTGGIS
jgi:uncharacterized protein YqgC (DUF456 family)